MYYILEGKKPKQVELEEWGRWFADQQNKIICQTKIGEIMISTVFLGLDHGHSMGAPLLFETMIFGIDNDDYQVRYATWEHAAHGHVEAVQLVQRKIHKKTSQNNNG